MAHPMVELGNIVKAHYGKALKQDSRNEAGRHAVYGSSGRIGNHDATLITDPTLVVGRKGSVGEVIWAPKGGWIIDTAYYLERVEPEGVDLRYLYYALKRANLGQKTITTSIPGLNRDDLYSTRVPLPTLAEQKRIAAILDKADAIRRKRQQAIQLADEFLRAVFLDMFGDPVTNPKGWDTNKFGSVGSLDRGKSQHRPRNDPTLLGGPHPLIQTGDVAASNGYVRTYKSTYSDLGLRQSKKWPAGTLCITIAANIAKTGILTFDACFPDSVVGFVPGRQVTVEYVQGWLGFLQKSLEASAPESAQKNINLAILRGLDMPVPDRDLQEKYSAIVAKVVGMGEVATASADLKDDLFGALGQRAFAGAL